jgi:hypothetical protein
MAQPVRSNSSSRKKLIGHGGQERLVQRGKNTSEF